MNIVEDLKLNSTDGCQHSFVVGNTMEYTTDINCDEYNGIFNNPPLLKKLLRFTNHLEMKFQLYQYFQTNQGYDFNVYGWEVSNLFDVSLNAIIKQKLITELTAI